MDSPSWPTSDGWNVRPGEFHGRSRGCPSVCNSAGGRFMHRTFGGVHGRFLQLILPLVVPGSQDPRGRAHLLLDVRVFLRPATQPSGQSSQATLREAERTAHTSDHTGRHEALCQDRDLGRAKTVGAFLRLESRNLDPSLHERIQRIDRRPVRPYPPVVTGAVVPENQGDGVLQLHGHEAAEAMSRSRNSASAGSPSS